jgi:hypothetical protein
VLFQEKRIVMAKPNIKELVVNHFEKGIFAVVALVALALLAGTRWAPYGHYPTEITRAVNEAEQKVAAKTWPEEEKQQFVVPEEKAVEVLVARNIGRQIDPTPYEFDVSFVRGMYDITKPITEPEFVGVGELIADAGRFLMALPPKKPTDKSTQEPATVAAANTPEEDPEADIPDEFKTRKPGAGTRPGGLGSAGAGLGMGGAGAYDEYGMDYGAGYGMEDPAMMAGYDDYTMMGSEMYPGGGMGMGMGGMAAPTMDGRGLRYVAVRGIIPLREQIRKYMKAIHVGFSQASNLYEIIEFELQRKKIQPGDDPWGSAWEPVDINIAIDTLNEALQFDPEVVQTSITDSAVTMPLPGRIMGQWKAKATHPRLENFTLSPEEIEKELAFNSMLLQQYQEQQQSEPEVVRKKGFSDIVVDSRSMQMGAMGMGYGDAMMQEHDYGDYASEMGGDMMGAGMGMMGNINYAPTSKAQLSPQAKQFLKELEGKLGKNADRKEYDKALLEYVQERITAQGELLLFRYFDFDVEPGATYKYQARLVVRNPNYGLPIAQVAGLATIVEGQTRYSAWSNETEPVTVPLDVDYFVDTIDEKGGGFAEARMAVFQWNPDFGTTIHSSLKVGFGQEIGGPKNTLVLNPAKNSFEVEPYKFHTGDVLVDALPEDKIDKRDHPDLELPRMARGSLGISGQVLISQGSGELAVIDRLSRMSAFKTRRQYLEYEQAPYEEIKNRAAKQADATDLESYAGEYGGEYGMDMMGMGGMGGMMGGADMYGGYGSEDYGQGRSGRRRGSALRKNPSRGRGGSSSGMGGMP